MLRSNLNTINDRIFNKAAIQIDDEALREVEACYRFLEEFEQGKVIYGINTGFGPMAQYRIGDADLNSLQYNIIRSHSCGGRNAARHLRAGGDAGAAANVPRRGPPDAIPHKTPPARPPCLPLVG